MKCGKCGKQGAYLRVKKQEVFCKLCGHTEPVSMKEEPRPVVVATAKPLNKNQVMVTPQGFIERTSVLAKDMAKVHTDWTFYHMVNGVSTQFQPYTDVDRSREAMEAYERGDA